MTEGPGRRCSASAAVQGWRWLPCLALPHPSLHLIPSPIFLLALLFLLSSLLSPSRAVGAALYDCGVDPRHLPVCDWTAAQLHSRLTHLLSSTPAAVPSSPALLSFVDHLLDEDVDGNVFLSLLPSEIDDLLAKGSAAPHSAGLPDHISRLMRLVMDEGGPSSSSSSPSSSTSTPSPSSSFPADIPTQCAAALAGVPAHERELLQLLAAEVQSIRQEPTPASAPKPYSGRWPSSALKRTLPPHFDSTPRPILVLWGDYEVDLSFILYHHQPSALIIQLTTQRKSDGVQQVRGKLDKRQSPTKRGRTSNVVLNLGDDALCLLRAAGIEPDLVHVSPYLFPLPDGCCRWWEGPTVVVGHSPGYPALHALALASGQRVYSDQPVWLLSKEGGAVGCVDDGGHRVDTTAPLLGLYMIVKDEAGGMEETMDSILPYLDGASVLDTGSTDGTDGLIARMMAQYEVPGVVHHGAFTDFSSTRNEALRLASAALNTTFLVMLNGDDTFIGGESLRAFLEPRQHTCGPSDEMYLLCVDYEGHKIAWSERVMRTSNHRHPDWPSTLWWHYEGLTHESYTHDLYAGGTLGDYSMTYGGRPTNGLDDGFRFHIYHTYVRDHKEKLHARAAKDAQLLLQQLETKPDDPRTLYYLSHSYDIQDKFHEAYQWHLRRTQKLVASHRANPAQRLEGDKEECTCLLRLGKIAAFRLPEEHTWEEAEVWFELTRQLCPEQIEARFYLAEHFYVAGDLSRAAVYAEEAEGLRVSGKGMMHILESDTCNKALPKLVQAIRGQQVSSGGGVGIQKGKGVKGGKKKKGGKKAQAAKKDEL